MARSDFVTLLPLDRYAEIMQIPLTHFNQLQGPKAPQSRGCDGIWDQDARDLLAWTMQSAEEMITAELGFFPSPDFVVDERHAFALTGVRSDWYNADIRTDHSYVECFGTEQLTLVQAGATVEYLDLDNDPLDREETAEIGNALYADLPACAEKCDVAVFFTVADGAEDAADEKWEIRPLKVDIDGSTMRIRAESSMFVRPNLWDLTEQDCFGSDDPDMWKWNWQTANLVTSVDVYCRTINKQTPVTLLWDGVCNCAGICAHKSQTGCAYPTDLKRGFFVPRAATWNGTTNIDNVPLYNFPPESVKASYRSGYPLKNCQMDPRLERAIIKLTNVLLPEPPCNYCDAAQVRWQEDRKAIDALTPESANMPWDLYARGALEAWRIVKRLAVGYGGKMGRV